MDHLGAWKEDGMELASSAVGVVVGVGTAKWVVEKLIGKGGALKKTDAAENESGLFPTGDLFPGATLVGALAPAAVGIAVQTYLAPKAGPRDSAAHRAVNGIAVGMMALSVGKVVSLLMPTAASYIPFNGLGMGDTQYDYEGFNGLGIGPGDVTAYMMNGAPTTAVDVNPFNGLGAGAPVDVELAGAPVSISGGMSASFY